MSVSSVIRKQMNGTWNLLGVLEVSQSRAYETFFALAYPMAGFATHSCAEPPRQNRRLAARWRRYRRDHKFPLIARNEALLALWPSPRRPTRYTCRLPARV